MCRWENVGAPLRGRPGVGPADAGGRHDPSPEGYGPQGEACPCVGSELGKV